MTGHPPYTTNSILQLVKMIKVEPIKWPDYLSEMCLSLLKGLLQKNPVSRLSWPNLLYHPFIYVHAMSQHPVISGSLIHADFLYILARFLVVI